MAPPSSRRTASIISSSLRSGWAPPWWSSRIGLVRGRGPRSAQWSGIRHHAAVHAVLALVALGDAGRHRGHGGHPRQVPPEERVHLRPHQQRPPAHVLVLGGRPLVGVEQNRPPRQPPGRPVAAPPRRWPAPGLPPRPRAARARSGGGGRPSRPAPTAACQQPHRQRRASELRGSARPETGGRRSTNSTSSRRRGSEARRDHVVAGAQEADLPLQTRVAAQVAERDDENRLKGGEHSRGAGRHPARRMRVTGRLEAPGCPSPPASRGAPSARAPPSPWRPRSCPRSPAACSASWSRGCSGRRHGRVQPGAHHHPRAHGRVQPRRGGGPQLPREPREPGIRPRPCARPSWRRSCSALVAAGLGMGLAFASRTASSATSRSPRSRWAWPRCPSRSRGRTAPSPRWPRTATRPSPSPIGAQNGVALVLGGGLGAGLRGHGRGGRV